MSGPATGPRLTVALLAIGAAMAFAGGCGEDDETTSGLDADIWSASAEDACAAGSRDAIDLPLPSRKGEVAKDVEARAAILVSVRDELTALGTPEGIDGEALSAYLDQLELDIEKLEAVGLTGVTQPLDESAGQAALELGLDECAAFANAIARTP